MRRYRAILIPCLLCVGLGTVASGCASGPTGVVAAGITGTVTVDGVGYPGALVTLSNSNRRIGQLLTNTEGEFRFFGSLEISTYTLTITQLPVGVNFPTTQETFQLRTTQELRFSFEGTTV